MNKYLLLFCALLLIIVPLGLSNPSNLAAAAPALQNGECPPFPLSGEQAGTTSTGTGEGTVTLDVETNLLSWTITYSGLTGPATAGHFHGPAAPGVDAGVVVPFPDPTSPITGTATLTDEQVTQVIGGLWYANIHTEMFPGGEIRGQVDACLLNAFQIFLPFIAK